MKLLESVLLGLVALTAAVYGDGDTVNTTSGVVRGVRVAPLGIHQFLGIPYAEAPEGARRFRPPVRKARMEGIFEASSNAKVCPQTEPGDHLEVTEDCLRLDVYVPDQTSPTKDEQFPVMVWVYGGRFTWGSSALYNSAFIAGLGRVIVVTLNYRMGVLGFLNTLNGNSVGNFALRDQCSAIEWVADNIEAFGGDARRVTIFGESAGAAMVMQLAMSSLCRGKFQRVIAQSGSPAAPWAYNVDPRKSCSKLAEASNCPSTSAGLVRCLRAKTWQDILNLQNNIYDYLSVDWAPYYGTEIFPDSPLEILLGKDSEGLRRFRSLDFLSGLNSEEGEYIFNQQMAGTTDLSKVKINETSVIFTDQAFEQLLRSSVSTARHLDQYVMDRLYPAVKFEYTDWKNRNDKFSKARSVVRLYSDVNFNIGGVGFANIHARGDKLVNQPQGQGRTYFYQFKPKLHFLSTYPWSNGATHADEIAFVFGFVSRVNGNTGEILLSKRMIEYWTNFAKTGSPNEPRLTMSEPEWPKYESETSSYIKLDLTLTDGSIDYFPYANRIAFWEELFEPELKQTRKDRENSCKGQQQQHQQLQLGPCWILFHQFLKLHAVSGQ